MVVHELSPDECDEVLSRMHVGRLACARHNQPYVVPVSFVFDSTERSLLGFSTVGQKIAWMRDNPRVCVAVDEIADDRHWTTVVVTGMYHEIVGADTTQLTRAQALLEKRADWWVPGTARPAHETERDAAVFYRILIREVTGRRTSGGAR
jgi:nitroimidazol reductase NimA-like FMN-containing flavoprotein (pyridoxamine 5'-phosphate oxidase superfamily)